MHFFSKIEKYDMHAVNIHGKIYDISGDYFISNLLAWVYVVTTKDYSIAREICLITLKD
jgi:hypothetical protein